MTASSAKVRSVKDIARLRFSIRTLLRNKMSNLEWSQCDARPIRDLLDSRIGAATEGQDKVNCHAFVQNAHRQKMQKNCFRCSVHGRKVTDVFSSAGQLAEKLRAAHYLIDPCWSKVSRAAARLSCAYAVAEAGHMAVERLQCCVGITEEKSSGDSTKGCISSFWKRRTSTSEVVSLGIASVFVCDHRVHQPTRA
jgi:hypothetical protein